jgi:hypothetical protein
MKRISLAEAIEGIEEVRRKNSIFYPLNEILMITLLAIICGATSYVKIEMFGKNKEEWLRKFLKLENGIPDACTIRNVIRQIDTQKLHKIFAEWMKGIAREVFGVVAVDGKQARRTKDSEKKPMRSGGFNMLYLVNRYMDAYLANEKDISSRAKAERYAKITAKTIIFSDGGDASSYGQNSFFCS